MARRPDPHTKDLFAWEAEPAAVGYAVDVAGRGGLDNKIARLVARALRDARDAGRSRAEIAEKMSTYLGRRIAEASIDKWSSESAEGHRIPLDAFIALIDATEEHGLLGFVPSLFGFAVVHERFVDIIELHQLEEHEREVAARKAALQAKARSRR